MAVRVVTQVWNGAPISGSELLVLLALADWADENGYCFPSIQSIAFKTRLSRSQAQRITHQLIKKGFLTVVRNEFGGKPGSSRHYQIVISMITDRQRATRSGHAQNGYEARIETGAPDAAQPGSNTSTTVNAASARNYSSKKSLTLAEFLEACKGAGEKAIHELDPIHEYIEKVGITDEMLVAAWQEFKFAYQSHDKRSNDWRRTFRSAVRGNWYKLWYLTEGQNPVWTSAGEQARRAAQ